MTALLNPFNANSERATHATFHYQFHCERTLHIFDEQIKKDVFEQSARGRFSAPQKRIVKNNSKKSMENWPPKSAGGI